MPSPSRGTGRRAIDHEKAWLAAATPGSVVVVLKAISRVKPGRNSPVISPLYRVNVRNHAKRSTWGQLRGGRTRSDSHHVR